MSSRRSNATYSTLSRYNTYSNIDHHHHSNSAALSSSPINYNNSSSSRNLGIVREDDYLVHRPMKIGRSPSPSILYSEQLHPRKEGGNYHVSVDLNDILSSNNIRPVSRMAPLGMQSGISSKQMISRITEQMLTRDGRAYQSDQGSLGPNPRGMSRTVLNLDGAEDRDVFELHKRIQSQRNPVVQSAQPPTKPPAYYSVPLQTNAPPRTSTQESGYAVKSISSSEVNYIRQRPKNEKVEFDLNLKGQLQREGPVQRSKTWEIIGTIPVKPKPRQADAFVPRRGEDTVRSRAGGRALEVMDEEYNDVVDAPMGKDTVTELENLLLCHPLIHDTPGSDIRVRREKDQLVERPRGQEEGTVNMDIIDEKVEIVMKSGHAQVLITVNCNRTVPIENSPYYMKSGVMVVKTMNFDMTESEARENLYQVALQKQNTSPGGRLDQHETNGLYKALIQLIKSEDASGSYHNMNGRSSSRRYQAAHENDYDERYDDGLVYAQARENFSPSSRRTNARWDGENGRYYYDAIKPLDGRRRKDEDDNYFMY